MPVLAEVAKQVRFQPGDILILSSEPHEGGGEIRARVTYSPKDVRRTVALELGVPGFAIELVHQLYPGLHDYGRDRFGRAHADRIARLCYIHREGFNAETQ